MTSSKSVQTWLFICAFSVFMMAMIGAVTRLTESGLSIVEWKPVTGAIPPLNDADWQKEFALYQESPQYQKVNQGMELSEFKKIFFWEWLHRLWGRLIGVIYALPLAYFWLRGKIPAEKRGAFIGILGLGFLQGAMGWYMVKSGLVDQPAVSHYRLAAHLMLAFIIFACMVRLGLAMGADQPVADARFQRLRKIVRATFAVALLTMTWGAFVAGLDAGMIYNTFPKMDDHWFPPEMLQHQPLWHAFVAEPATVQFTHRILAILVFIKVLLLVTRARKLDLPGRARQAVAAVGMMIVVQVGLGIATLLSQVNTALATAHQAGAMLLLTSLVWLIFELPKEKKNG